MGITVLCPTRNNPSALLEAYASYRETAMERDTRFVAVIDADDPVMEAYISAIEDTADLRIDVVPRSESGSMNKALNFAALRWKDSSDVVGFIGDDHRFRTKGWDRVIGSIMQSTGGGFVYGNDLFQGEALPTAIFISSPIITALGWFGPPACKHLYLDNTWKLLGDRADCLYYLPDIVIEHMHPAAGKGEWDANHVRVNASEMYDHDRVAFEAWLADGVERDVATVSAAIAS